MKDALFLIEEKNKSQHRLLTGRVVSLYTVTALRDVEKRIEDAIHSRDNTPARSDARIYYNGILRVLRRKLRDIQKVVYKDENQNIQEAVPRRIVAENSDEYVSKLGMRVLKLSGIM